METPVIPKAWEVVLNSASFLPVIIKSIERIHDPSWSMDYSIHEHYEMVYMEKGQAVFEVEGRHAPMGPNDMIIIKPNQKHKFSVKSKEGCMFIVMYFRFENRFGGEYSKISLEDFLNFVQGREAGPFITLKVSQKNEIIMLLNRITREKAGKEPGSEFLEHLLVLELFVLISRALKMEWEDSIKEKTPKVKELISASVKFINNNFERDISLKDIANYVFLSSSYFSRVFREEMGITPISYLLKVRIERAKEMLRETDAKISDIAVSVGFSHQQRFNDIFKKHTGMSPMQYRKQVKNH